MPLARERGHSPLQGSADEVLYPLREDAFFRSARIGAKLTRMMKETEAKWVERVREWRASGLSAEEFAASTGFKASTLSWAASLLRRATPPPAPAAASTTAPNLAQS